ncbi:MAG: tyrosine-type recombinase/integrase, partial [Clostridiales bacterium]|nr:tyrosine-type recombinase/integrase [Clostridiales bacterium]
EYAENTVKGFRKDVSGLLSFLEGRRGALTKEELIAYKKTLEQRLAPASVNRHIASLNKFTAWLGLSGLTLKTLKIQEPTTEDKALTVREFDRLLTAAVSRGKHKLALILLTLAGTGLRIGELKFVTAEAVKNGAAVVRHTGKIRAVILSEELQRHLTEFRAARRIVCGPLFTGSGGAAISRSYVAREMKKMARLCGVDPAKAFPHNLRHYFARRFLESGCPLSDLADVLGHKSVDTTRRYLRVNAAAQRRQLAKMKLLPVGKRYRDFSVQMII